MSAIIPHHVVCCCFIKNVMNEQDDLDFCGQTTIQLHCKRLLTILRLLQHTTTTWAEFQLIVKDSITIQIFTVMVKEILEMVNLEELLNSFASFQLLIGSNENQLKPSSILGLFMRKTLLEFKKMSFENISKLCISLNDYLNLCSNEKLPVTVSSISNMNCSMDIVMGEDKENVELPNITQDYSNKISLPQNRYNISRDYAARFISEQAYLLETKELTGLKPIDLQCKIDEIQYNFSDIHETYYLSFLNYLRIFEIHPAISMLQKFFDYMTFNEVKEDEDISVLEKHQLKFKRFRYCALNLGIMHCYQENYSEALMSLDEAVRISQETNDQNCLNHAMFWLSLVKEEISIRSGNEEQLKQICVDRPLNLVRSEENHLSQMIDFLGWLRLIKLQALRGAQAPGKLLSTVSQLLSTSLIANTGHLVRSSMLAFYGFSEMGLLLCQIPLQQMKSNLKLYDRYSLSDEDQVITMCQLATHFKQGGFYDQALDIISFSQTKLSLYNVHQKKLKFHRAMIQFHQCVATRNIGEIFSLVESIQTIHKFEGILADCMKNILIGNFSVVYNQIESRLTSIDSSSSLTSKSDFQAHLRLLEIEVHLLSAYPSQAVHKILELLDFVTHRYMGSLKIDVNICFVRYLFLTGMIDRALSVIEDFILDVLSNGSIYQQGMIFYLQSKCLMEKVKQLTDAEQKSNLLLVISLLDKSLDYFQKGNFVARLKDVFYTRAIVFNYLEYYQDRNKAATQYCLLYEKLKDLPNVLLF